MSDDQAAQAVVAPGTPAPKGAETETTAAAPSYTPPATQADLDRIITDRVSRERAKFGDYGDLKAKASKFDEITEAQKTELQKITERAEAAERRAQELETAQQIHTWKADISKETGVPASALRGSSLEDITAHAETLKALIPAPDAKRGAIGPYVPGEGQTPSAPLGSTPAEQFAEIIRSARGATR